MTKRTIALGPFKRALLFGALGGALALIDLVLIVPAAKGQLVAGPGEDRFSG